MGKIKKKYTQEYREAAEMAVDLVAAAEKVFAPGHVNRGYAYATTANALQRAGRYEEAEKYALQGLEIVEKAMGDSSWAAEQSIEVVRRVYAAWPGHQEQLRVWSLRTLRCRMMRAHADELNTTLKLIQGLTVQCLQAKVDLVSNGALQEMLWRERDTLAPPGHPRRAAYLGNYALMCDAIEGCDHARESLALAEEALKDAKEERDVASDLIAVGHVRLGK